MDPWQEIQQLTGKSVPQWAKDGCIGPKLVHVPAGRTLYGAGSIAKLTMEWGAFEESDLDWYLCGNQLKAEWYLQAQTPPIPIYEYRITLATPTPAVMSKVADQPGAAARVGPMKFQYYNPAGFGRPVRGKLLGNLS
jgi:hypothetical protein